MPKLVVGPISKGLQTGVLPFNIDNDAFPTLFNAYEWRLRIKRRRGTAFVGRLQRFIGTTDGSGALTVTISPQPISSGLASFTVTGNSGTNIFYDPGGASPVTLITNGAGSGTLNRTTGVLSITGSQANANVIYFPTLPVMGLRDLNLNATQFPSNLGFDTTYSYNIVNTTPAVIYDVSFFKNPSSGSFPVYTQKATWTPLNWNGLDYQQFWTINYQNALWATNGLNVPFVNAGISMQYAGPATTPALTSATRVSATTMSFTITGNPLVVGDFVFANEFTASGGGDATALNFQTGYVTSSGNTFTVTFPDANIPAGSYTPGILQYLTNLSNNGVDVLRWYDGDPTNGQVPPSFVTGKGWVNFAPPLSQANFSIADLPAAQYYLVGAKLIFPFKDRLLFFGPVVQTSAPGSQVYLPDTIIYSQNGTPYYTASFTNSPSITSIATVFNQILVPPNQTADPRAYWCDVSGFGGFITAGVAQPIISVGQNQDTLIVGFSTFQSKVVYTGNDIIPFNFYSINSELGTNSTFSSITMDKGVLSRGSRGLIVTSQTGASRIDLDIPDQAFQFNLANNGSERVTAQRDFINEWCFFSYPDNDFSEYADGTNYRFNTQTLLYNYREESWGIFDETYTTYGYFRPSQGFTWSTIGTEFASWLEWNEPWNAGQTTIQQQNVIAGTQHGFIVMRVRGTNESSTLSIQNISSGTFSCPNHCLSNGDYILIQGCFGTISQQVNGRIFQVTSASQNTFVINNISGTYLGGGTITKIYVPYIQTKQFPVAWEMGRKTRIGAQQYLLTTTNQQQITLLIFLSQDASNAYNDPSQGNDSLIYSQVLYTCPESTNLGLTPANINLQMLTYPGATANSQGNSPQAQIWHRVNTSLIGDTVQLGFTLSDSQVRTLLPDPDANNSFAITGASNASSCILQCTGQFAVGTLLQITGVLGMLELNFNPTTYNYFFVTGSSPTTVTLAVDSTTFGTYMSGGVATPVVSTSSSAFSEIELHGFIMDLNPSQVLA